MPRIVVFGDSNVAGSVESWKDELFPRAHTWPGLLYAKYGTVYIDGEPGRLLDSSVQQLSAQIAKTKAEIVILCIGINDLYYNRLASTVIAQLQQVCTSFEGQIMYVLHPGVAYSHEALLNYQKALFVACQLEFYQKISQLAALIIRPDACTLGADRWHFSLKGHEIVFDLVDAALQKIIQNNQ